MKRLALLTLSLTLAPLAVRAAGLRERVVFYDPDYDPAWVEQPEQVAAFFTRRGFTARTVPEMVAWLSDQVARPSAAGTSATFAMGVAPVAMVTPPFKDCLLARYLRAGGRVVWLTNIPMYIAQDELGPIRVYGDVPRQELLGLTFDAKTYYAADGAAQVTALGREWGLEPCTSLLRPVHLKPPLQAFVASDDGHLCSVGLVPFAPGVPRSGFIFQPDYLTPDRLPALRNAWRLASYDGQPLALPEASPPPAPRFAVEAALRFGERDERSCYLRGEVVPLVLRLRAPQVAQQAAMHLRVNDGAAVLKEWRGELAAGTAASDTVIGSLDLGGRRAGDYPVVVTVTAGGQQQRLERLLRVCPPPDHSGTHVGLWVSTSPHRKRTEHLLRWLGERDLEPLFCDDNALAHDLALAGGFSFAVRRHGEPANWTEAPGYDSWRRSWNGEILRVGAQGGKRTSRGYASPFRRAAEAAAFGAGIAFDNRFPAFRKRAVTGDDYSQWFGADYNRYAVDGFRARFGSDPPRPKAIEDSDEVDKVTRPDGIIPDDDPWLLLNRYWCEDIHADMAGRLAQAMRDSTDGTGRVGQISGGMQIPAMQLWSAQYPPFLFGPRGYNLTSFYYYSTLWQPPLAHLWWLECARMGNRRQEQWIMPDCCYEGRDSDALYTAYGWLMLAGGATGLEYYQRDEMTPGGEAAMRRFGQLSHRHGQLLAAIHPAPKRVGLLVPFEQLVYQVTSCIELAYPFMDLLQAKVDVEPVAFEELEGANLLRYPLLVLAHTRWLSASHAARLDEYVKAGGRLVCDAPTAKALKLPGAITLDQPIGGTWLPDYGRAERVAKLQAALAPHLPAAPVTCDQPLVTLRRFADDDGGQYLWVNDNLSGDEYLAMRDALKAGTVGAKATAFGYGQATVTATLRRADDGTLPVDALTGEPFATKRDAGQMAITVPLPRWQGRLVAFVPGPCRALAVQPPRAVYRGLEAVFAVALRGDQGPWPALEAVRVTVTDPAGQPNREYGRRLLCQRGSGDYRVRFAANDLAGRWRFRFDGLSTQQSAEAEVTLP